jgi:hypothetical protein
MTVLEKSILSAPGITKTSWSVSISFGKPRLEFKRVAQGL